MLGMELGRGGMLCTYAGKGGLKWLGISRDRFRAGLAKNKINQMRAWKVFSLLKALSSGVTDQTQVEIVKLRIDQEGRNLSI